MGVRLSKMVDGNFKPVVIVGAGPTGLVVAIELARRGVPFHLIDRRLEPVNWSRAIFIKSRTLEILESLGLRQTFYECGQIVNRVDLYSDEAKMASYSFDGLDTPFPYILSVPEEATIRILTDKLEKLGGMVERGVDLVWLQQNEQYVYAKMTDKNGCECYFDASIIVGADGYHSTVRKLIAVKYERLSYQGRWGVFDTGLSNWIHGRDAVCAQLATPIVIPFPLGKKLWRVYFWSEASESGGLSLVVKRLRVLSPKVDLASPGELQYFHSHSSLARAFRVGRVFLAGDAAHTSNPIEGHGMNIGIQDAYNLGWKLASIVSGQATEELIASYEAERQPTAKVVVHSGDEAYARMMPLGTDALQALFAFVSTTEGQGFAALAESEIALGYDQSPIIEEIGAMSDASPRTTKVGFRVGDVDGLIRQGQPCRLHELVAGDPTVFVLLGATRPVNVLDAFPDLEPAIRSIRGNLNVYIVTCCEVTSSTVIGEVLLDPMGKLHERLGADKPRLVLIRPDGHIGFSCAPPCLKALRTHLRRMFLPA